MAVSEHTTTLPVSRLPQREPRPRKLKPGEADFIIKQIADRGDAIGFGPNGTVFVLAEIDRRWFDKLCAFGAAMEDLEDSDEDDDMDNDREMDGTAEGMRYAG